MIISAVALDIARAERILQQFSDGALSWDDTISALMRQFGLELQDAEVLLAEYDA